MKKGRQKHGFYFEEFMIKKLGLIKSKGHKAKWDAKTQYGTPVSIKFCKKGNEIVFGDIFRQYSIQEEFLLIVGFYERTDDVVEDVKVYEIPAGGWRQLFNSEAVDYLRDLIESAGKGNYGDLSSKEDWDKLSQIAKDFWANKTLNIMRPRPRWAKRNIKTDKSYHRIQCAIPYNSFKKNFTLNKNIKKTNYDITMEYYNYIEEIEDKLEMEEVIKKEVDEAVERYYAELEYEEFKKQVEEEEKSKINKKPTIWELLIND